MAKTSVAAFPAEYLQLLIHASRKEFSFTMSWNEAFSRRANFYAFRAALTREGHHAADLVKVVTIKLSPRMKPANAAEPGSAVLTFTPRDGVFADLIAEALSQEPAPTAPAPTAPTTTPATTPNEGEASQGTNFDLDKIFKE